MELKNIPADDNFGGLGQACWCNIEYKEHKCESSMRIYLSWEKLSFDVKII